MPDPAPEDLTALLDLADTDAAIRRLTVALDDLPENRQLAEIDQQVEQLRGRRGDLGLERDEAAATMRTHERTTSHLRARLDEEQQRMYQGQITNAKQLSKLEAEIAAVQGKIDEQETAELEAMEEMEAHEAMIADIDRQIEELADQREVTEQARDEAAAGMVAEVAEREVARDRYRDAVPDELLATYDDAARRHRGNAVGRLDDNSCSACGIRLSYADLNALLEGPPLSTCPSCGRLIVVP